MQQFKKVPFYLLLFITISLPFHRWLPSGLGIGLLLISWLTTHPWNEIVANWKRNKSVLWFVAFYSIVALSALYSSNKVYAGKIAIQYLPILLMPIILSSISLSKKQLRVLMYTFINAVFIASLMGIVAFFFSKNSIIQFIFGQTPTVNLYYITKHPAYLSIQLLLAVFLQLHYSFIIYKNNPAAKQKLLFGFIKITVFIIIILLMARRLQMLAFVVLLPVFLVLRSSPKNRKRLSAIASVITILFIALALVLPFTRTRIEMTIRELKGGPGGEVASPRVDMWKIGGEIVADNPFFGVGVGDAKDELFNRERGKICTAISQSSTYDIVDQNVPFKHDLIEEFYQYEIADEAIVLDNNKLEAEVVPGKVYQLSVNIIEWIPNHIIIENGGNVVYDSKPIYNPRYVFRATDPKLEITKTIELDTVAIQEVTFFQKNYAVCNTVDLLDENLSLSEIGTLGKALQERFNFHNQFMQSVVGVGIVGLFFMLGIFVLVFKKSYQYKDSVFFIYGLLIVLSFLTESLLLRELGVLLFGYLIPVFMYLQPTTPEGKRALPDEKSQ